MMKKGGQQAQQYLELICQRLDTEDAVIQAFLAGNGRSERLKNEWQELQQQTDREQESAPLFGIPIGVKDIFRADGFETRAGSLLPPELFSGKEATAVTRLKKAGALVLGKTVTTEFAYFCPGPTRNPRNTAHTPGGSSSGSAAAVAAGFVPLALGTQTIGSVIRPASYCGIYGLKPSYGRISAQGVIPFSPSADYVGFFTATAESIAIAARVLYETWDENLYKKEPMLKFGVASGKYLQQAEPRILEVFKRAVEKIRTAGYEVAEADPFTDISEINDCHRKLVAAELAEVHQHWYADYHSLYRTHTAELIQKGMAVSAAELKGCRESCISLCRSVHDLMDRTGITVWLSPSTSDLAPSGIESTGSPVMNLPWTHARMPVINIPLKVPGTDLPAGLSISSAYGTDEMLIAASEKISVTLR